MAMNSPFESLISSQGNDLTNWLCASVIVFTNITNLPALFDFIPISIEGNNHECTKATIIFYR
jgi:hypothetical protein